MPSKTRDEPLDHTQHDGREHSKLILCFDGTGNQYNGNPSDTNIVKLYQKFDRENRHQFHYYQPGIGTYTSSDSVNTSWWGGIKRSISQTLDEGYGTTFDQHVIAGYRFIMRYYGDHDKIYIFGFSRGAFTARFLARMIATIGLLSMGNEEMVPFAYKTYQDSQTGLGGQAADQQIALMESFQTTFCRQNVKVHFLGLFDTVNSVGVFDNPFAKTQVVTEIKGTAEYVRHAVSLDERRSKFKAALLIQEKNLQINGKKNDEGEDIKEVWFPGNHGDVGGGWFPDSFNSNPKENPTLPPSYFGLKRDNDEWEGASKDAKWINPELNDPVQLSDIALEWMITELDKVEAKEEDVEKRLKWNYHKDLFLYNYYTNFKKAIMSRKHDVLAFKTFAQYKKEKEVAKQAKLPKPKPKPGLIGSWFKTCFWHLLEMLPFKHMELYSHVWVESRIPNMGNTRDVPDNSMFHPSVMLRMQLCAEYRPQNTGSDHKKGPRFIDHKSAEPLHPSEDPIRKHTRKHVKDVLPKDKRNKEDNPFKDPSEDPLKDILSHNDPVWTLVNDIQKDIDAHKK